MRIFISSSLMMTLVFLFTGICAQPASTDTVSIDDLTVLEFLICEDVVEREPVNVLQSYTMNNERAWSFARIRNSGGMRKVTFIWYHEDEKLFELESRIGKSSNWRTYSSTLLQPGAWRVELHDDNGNKLREVRFHVAD